MASPDAAPTEPERWRDLDMLLTRPGNLVEASFDPSPTVSRRRLALLLLCLSV
jgi:NEDD8-activating enzyme E1